MERLKYPFNHEWHVSINRHHDRLRNEGKDRARWMYEAKSLADEVPRLTTLFKMERTGRLAKTHKQYSMQAPVPVEDNRLKCCLGVKCKDCPELIALDSICRSTPEEIDTAKAWTCAAHIISKGGDVMNEGYVLTVDDRMYWDNVYESLSQCEEG